MGKWYYKIWKNGKYLDLWSVNHVLAGSVIAWPLYKLGVPVVYNFGLAMLLIVGWEIYEIIYNIRETWQNRATDIITGIIGFVFVSNFVVNWPSANQQGTYLIILVIWLILEVWGYRAYTKGNIK